MYTPGGHRLTQAIRDRIVALSKKKKDLDPGLGPTAIAKEIAEEIGGGLTRSTVSTVIASAVAAAARDMTMYEPGGYYLTQATRDRIVALSKKKKDLGPTALAKEIGGGLTRSAVSAVIADAAAAAERDATMYTPRGYHLIDEISDRIVDLKKTGLGPTAIAKEIRGGLTKGRVTSELRSRRDDVHAGRASPDAGNA
jgi:hypothetical protein